MELDNVADTATDTPLKLIQTSAVIALLKYLTYRYHEPECRSSRLLLEFITGVLFRLLALTLRRLMSYIYLEHPFLMFLDHTQRRSTVGRTPLDE